MVCGNVLRECARAKKVAQIRMLPISGSIFAGDFREPEPFAKIPSRSLKEAVGDLAEADKAELRNKKLEMCIILRRGALQLRIRDGNGFGRRKPPAG